MLEARGFRLPCRGLLVVRTDRGTGVEQLIPDGTSGAAFHVKLFKEIDNPTRKLKHAIVQVSWLPMLVFEVTLALWLIIRGVAEPRSGDAR